MPGATLTQPTIDLDAVNRELANAEPADVIRWASETFGGGLAMTSSFGAESAVSLHMATRIVPRIPVITVDTGYFFPETYKFMEELRKRFDLNLKVYQSPISPARMEAIYGKLWEKEFGEEGLTRYNRLRKVEPMERAIKEIGVKAWVAGLRADQTDHRATLRTVEMRPDGVYKVQPILKWTAREIDIYMTIHDLPYHPLKAEGYSSIGDYHTTEKADGREGRFGGLKQECGIHLPETKSEDQSREAADL